MKLEEAIIVLNNLINKNFIQLIMKEKTLWQIFLF